ncbi:MAG: hypothetical protein LBQ90_04480, partial [Synergistaceae bacterium]|nr:hypothetical protein [Synergistaceae bacterium]
AFAGAASEFVDTVPMHKSDVSDAVARYGNFIMCLDEYDDHFLYDVRPLGGDRMGVILLSPGGYEKNLVFKASETGELISIYEHVSVPRRNFLRTLEGKGILVSSARDLAQKFVRQNERREKTVGHA